MLTSFGRFLRKLRIDQGEILKDMADKLDTIRSLRLIVETDVIMCCIFTNTSEIISKTALLVCQQQTRLSNSRNI